MKRRTPLTVAILCLSALMIFAGCTKRCRCYKNNTTVDYYSQQQLSELGKTCSEMVITPGLAVQRYSYCEWVYGE